MAWEASLYVSTGVVPAQPITTIRKEPLSLEGPSARRRNRLSDALPTGRFPTRDPWVIARPDTLRTVTTDQYTPHGDYQSIRNAAANRIAHFAHEATKTPFDPKQLGVHARVLKKGFDAHTTADESVGSDCVKCRQPWPCASIRLIFVPLNVLD